MSISNAFGISRSGLVANSQWAETVSGNIANADRRGYGRRTVDFTATMGGGVITTGLSREADQSLVRMYRTELGRLSRQDAIAAGLTTYAAALGEPGDTTSPAQRLAELQTSLDLLFNAPSDVSAQRGAVQSAQSLARGLNQLSATLEATVRETRTAVAGDLANVNTMLSDLADLNRRIELTEPGSLPRAVLEDEIAAALDDLSEHMDIRTDTRNSGRVDVYTSGGARLVEGQTAFVVEFDAATSRLSADGIEITPPSDRGFSEGTLSGQFELLNRILPQMRGQLDEYARALMETFEAADASLAPGAAGLFTDEGAAFDPTRLTGLAGRIAVNDAVLPEAGGALWRMRDGIGALTEGAPGVSDQVGAFIDGLDARQSFDSATGLPSDLTLGEFAASFMAFQKTVRAQAQEQGEALTASAAAIEEAKLGAQGVNVDDELQQLLMIEKSYAANSQVVSTLSAMLDALLNAV